MECNKVLERLHEHIYGELDKKSSAEIEAHISCCMNCRKEYMRLKQLLVGDAKALREFSEKIEVPQELAAEIRSSIKRKATVRPLKYLAAACLILVFLYTAPVFAYYAGQLFPIERYTGLLDKDTIKDFEEGRGQVIGKSSAMNGVTFTVDGMIKKGDRFNILFTIKVPVNKDYNYGFPASGFNVITVQDQFGRKYMVGGASGTTARAQKLGESQYMFEIGEPLSFWSYKLKVRITAIELGINNEEEGKLFQKYKNIYGDWKVDFKINRSIYGR